MKKVSAILLALAMVFSLAMFASADAASDLDEVINILSENADKADIESVISDALAVAGVQEKADAADVTDVQSATVADTIIEKFKLEGDKAEKVQNAMSNDFVSFLAGLYIKGKPVVKPQPDTGSSPAIAIAAFATLSAAAAVAFVAMKKKED